MSSSGDDLLLVGGGSEQSGDETSTEELLPDGQEGAEGPKQAWRSPAHQALSRLKQKLDVGVAPSHGAGDEDYKVYPWRWFMLAVLCLLNLSNGMVCYCTHTH
jgi:hypothetical protein